MAGSLCRFSINDQHDRSIEVLGSGVWKRDDLVQAFRQLLTLGSDLRNRADKLVSAVQTNGISWVLTS